MVARSAFKRNMWTTGNDIIDIIEAVSENTDNKYKSRRHSKVRCMSQEIIHSRRHFWSEERLWVRCRALHDATMQNTRAVMYWAVRLRQDAEQLPHEASRQCYVDPPCDDRYPCSRKGDGAFEQGLLGLSAALCFRVGDIMTPSVPKKAIYRTCGLVS